MSQNFLFNASFHLLLIAIDQEIANDTMNRGCQYCGGKLHLADYPRSPVGIPPPFRHRYEERLSFCCDTCRKRITPPSVRFFGRRWYPAPHHLLVSALMLGINERRLSQIKRHFGITVTESTWKRWRRGWRDFFPLTSFWQREKALAPSINMTNKSFPRVLLNLFESTLENKMTLLLRFLSPLTGGHLRAV